MSFDGVPEAEHERIAAEARARIPKWVGIPWCVGIGPTKTLAKLCNKVAKETPNGVMTTLHESPLLERLEVEDVWGGSIAHGPSWTWRGS